MTGDQPARRPAPRTPPRAQARGQRTAGTSLARWYAARPPAAPPGAPRTRRRPPRRSPLRPSPPHPAARPARTPEAAHACPGTARPAAWERRSSGSGPPRGHHAGNPTRTPSAWRTPGSPGAGTAHPARPSRKHRRSAGTAIPWPRATPPRIPPRDRGQTKARRDPSCSSRDSKILTLPSPPGPQHEKRAPPSSPPRCSDSQAVNSRLADRKARVRPQRGVRTEGLIAATKTPNAESSTAIAQSGYCLRTQWHRRHHPASGPLRRPLAGQHPRQRDSGQRPNRHRGSSPKITRPRVNAR